MSDSRAADRARKISYRQLEIKGECGCRGRVNAIGKQPKHHIHWYNWNSTALAAVVHSLTQLRQPDFFRQKALTKK